MSTVYALIVGIDEYRAATVGSLTGARNDAVAALAYLRSRVGDLQVRELYDEQATRAAIIDAIRAHLGRAGAGDTAVLWYAGHGSEAPVPPELWARESEGLVQSLVCADSRDGDVPDLYDKELAVLLDQVAATGAHVAAVMDSCHSGGVTREIPEATARARRVSPATRAPRPETLIPELHGGWDALPDTSRHVLLAACRADQLAQEFPLDDVPHGVFSWALLRALNQLGPHATYRELLAAARCTVEDRTQFQAPQLAGDVPADQPFLGGALRAAASRITMRHLDHRWEIDAGSCHGMPPATPGPLRVAVAGDGPVRPARVTAVSLDRSVVEPDGWQPDPERQYPVVVTQLPEAHLAVDVAGSAELAELVERSPFLRIADTARGEVPDLRFSQDQTGAVRILGAGELPVAPDLHGPDLARRAVRAGEHIARWRQVQALENPGSPLAGAVRLEIVAAGPGETQASLHRLPERPDADGLIQLAYTWRNGTPTPPTAFLRLHNTTGRSLYCVLLNLTERYRVHASLFPGAFVGPGLVGAALNGRPVQFSLPGGVPPTRGAQVRDRVKLIVAEQEFAARPFEQDALDDAVRRGVLPRVAMTRDAGDATPTDVYDWATTTLTVITTVP
ncbi:caspase family protein [Actinoplanes sp. NPDC049596]|uniref:caspase family protein n=1 Tax=unclassified Actinoplanes TaxID=2626549 RepID=UPI003434FF66